ncbi:baculoviral IAP repeat-containing protein 1f-like [Amphiura filiformis]|uniref:baculoviral IAP repeat-containing protein 1f-like n=1 Tax=Amphiura filiformis TaxID=82378 RepID=UPI003B2202B4
MDTPRASCSQDSSASDVREIDFRGLASQLGTDWEQLATRLGFTINEIQRLRIDGKDRGITNVIFDMLTQWKQRQPETTSLRRVLKEAFESIERQDLADKICSSGREGGHKRKHSDDGDDQPPQKYQRSGDGDATDNGNAHHNCHLEQPRTESTAAQKEKRKKKTGKLKLASIPNFPYNSIIMKLNRMSAHALEDCKILLRQDMQGFGIQQDEINQVQSGDGFVKLMESKNLLHPDNLCFLQILLFHVEKDSSLEEVKIYANSVLENVAEYAKNRDGQPITLFITKNNQPDGTRRVELRIEGRAKHTKNKQVKAFIIRVAKNLGMKPHQINLIGQGRGSVILILQIPVCAVSRLRDAVTQKADWLIDNKVLGVHIEGEAYQEVMSPVKQEGTLEIFSGSKSPLNLEEFFSCLMCMGNQDIEMDMESQPSSSCAGCSLPLLPDHSAIHAKDNHYHHECFTCVTCCQPIQRGSTFYIRQDGKLLCLQHLIAAMTNDIQQLKIFTRTNLETDLSSTRNIQQGCPMEQPITMDHNDGQGDYSAIHDQGRQKPSVVMDTGGEQLAVNKNIDFDMQHCQRALRHYYLQSYCRIPLKFSNQTSTTVDIEDIYVDLSLSLVKPKPCQLETIHLSSYHDMFSEIGSESPPNRIMIKGHAGSGKTSLISKIAYDWAKGTEESPLKDISLLFVLNMASIDVSNIEEAIITQLLPEDTCIKAEDLKAFIGKHSNRIMLILDGFDAAKSAVSKSCIQREGSLVKATSNKILRECHIVVTTRCLLFEEGFRYVEVSGFSMDNVNTYIKKFFAQKEELGDKLVSYISTSALIKGISIVPLMLVELCLMWSNSKGACGIRTTELFKAILNRISSHSKSGTIGELNMDDLTKLLGELALTSCVQQGTLTTGNQLSPVLSKNLKLACQLGIMVCTEPFERTAQVVLPVMEAEETLEGTNHAPCVSQVSFLHKTFQEYCAAVYLVSLLEENDTLFWDYLESHNDVDKAIGIQPTLSFACGLSPHVAKHILPGLLEIFSSQLEHSVFEFYNNKLLFDASCTMQDFILLCLECNFEAQAADEYIALLSKLIPTRKLKFVGVSDSSAVAITYFLCHSQPLSIESIVLRAPPTSYDETDDELWKTVSQTQRKPVSKSTIGKMVRNELVRLECDKLEDHLAVTKTPLRLECDKPEDQQLAETKTPLRLLASIHLRISCGLLKSATPFTLAPILLSLKHVKLASIDIKGFDVQKEVTQLMKSIENGLLPHLSVLKLADTGLHGYQTEKLAQLLCLMPSLQVLDLSNNEAGHCLPMLGASLSKCPFLQAVDIKHMKAQADDVVAFLEAFQEFGHKVVKFHLSGNEMSNLAVHTFVRNVLKSSSLNDLAVSVGDVSRQMHKLLIESCQGVPSLQKLSVSQSHFPNDLLMYTGELCNILDGITTLSMEVDWKVSPGLNHSAWVEFKNKLQRANQLKRLYLYNIALKKSDFEELLEVGCQQKLDRLRYFTGCLPEDLILKPDYDFLELL